jgi:hypothetical protein
VLSRDETNELLARLAASARDALPETEAQTEYQALGALQAWQRYPEALRLIGRDGAPDIGRPRLGEALNAGHLWGLGVGFALGRGVSMALGHIDGQAREDQLREGLTFVRDAWIGLRGPGAPPFAVPAPGAPTVCDHTSETDAGWLLALVADAGGFRPLGPSRELAANAAALAATLRFGSPYGSHHLGPFDTDDGRHLLVREDFLADELHHWSDVADGLPHAITQVLVCADRPQVSDTGVLTHPADVRGTAVFVTDRWDGPTEAPRPLSDEQCAELADRCRSALRRLHRRLELMSRRDRVLAGAQVYYVEPIAPLARAAGVFDTLREELDLFELDRLVSDAYYELVPGGAAARLLPGLVQSGAGFAAIKEPISAREAMPALHQLALHGQLTELPVAPDELIGAGLVSGGEGGYQLTDAGRSVHERLLDAERRDYDVDRLAQAYQRFVALDEPLDTLVRAWAGADAARRSELLVELTDLIQRARVALRRTNEQLVRFEPYLPKLRRALGRAERGEPEYVDGQDVESVYAVWQVLHRDYRLTQNLD